MKILTIIPARGSSKRIPQKNLKLLKGKALISWTLDLAIGLQNIAETLVSTDSQSIADLAQRKGALVPWLRPSHLATDESPTIDTVLHALDWYEMEKGKVDGVLLLQPTTPFRTKEYLEEGIKVFADQKGKFPVLGMLPAQPHPAWCFVKDNDKYVPSMGWSYLSARSQDLPPAFSISGDFYLSSTQSLRNKRSFFTEGFIPLVSKKALLHVDIDTQEDWERAEIIAQSFS